MNIRRVFGKNLMSFKDFDVTYPTKGVVLVSGQNGAGKTALTVEVPAYAIWGKTLRGEDPWPGDDGEVGVELADGTIIRRLRRGGRTTLDYDGADFESSTKAQEAIVSTYGDLETWRRTSTFSVADAAYFSEATDAERKRLLENLLGLTKFDAALAAARLAAGTASATVAGSQANLESKLQHLRSLEQRAAELASLDTAVPDVSGLEEEKRKLTEDNRTAKAEYDTYLTLLGDVTSRLGAKAAELSQAARAKSGTCPTCGQAVSSTCVIDVEDARAAHASLVSQKQQTQTMLTQAESKLRAIRDRQTQVSESLATAEAAAKRAASLHTIQASVQAELETTKASVATIQGEIATAEADLALQQAAVLVLGTRGVRGAILSKALTGLNAAANVWLSRMAPGVTLEFQAQTERKSGAVSDVISFHVKGLAKDKGYRALSAGQRARIDLAVLLGLAELSGGLDPGGLFMDEVFDRLDQDGVESVVRVLGELAGSRPVTVITHSRDVADRLRTVGHANVYDGKVYVDW